MSNLVPVGWSYNKLSELAFIDNDSLKSSTAPDYKFKYVDIASVSTGVIKLPNEYIQFKDAPSRARKRVKQGDVLMSTVRPNLQAFAYFDANSTDYVASTGFSVIRAKDGNDGKFLFNTILTDDVTGQIDALIVGSNYPAINSSDVKTLQVLTPTKPEQQKIAQILTSVDEVIEKTQAQIDKLKDLKTAMMQELLTKGIGHVEFKDSPVGMIPVGWDCVKMNKIAKVTDGAHFTPTYMTKGVPFLRVTDLKNKSIFNGNIKFIPLNEHEELIKRCNPEKGDILFSKNGTIGLTRLIDWDDEFSIFVSLALIKILSNKVTPEYLTLFMESPIVKYQIKMRSKQGSVTNLHLEEIREFDIPLPSVVEQTEIIKMLSSIINKLDSVEKKHENLVNLKKALMQDLLTGKVRVNTEQSNSALTVG